MFYGYRFSYCNGLHPTTSAMSVVIAMQNHMQTETDAQIRIWVPTFIEIGRSLSIYVAASLVASPWNCHPCLSGPWRISDGSGRIFLCTQYSSSVVNSLYSLSYCTFGFYLGSEWRTEYHGKHSLRKRSRPAESIKNYYVISQRI